MADGQYTSFPIDYENISAAKVPYDNTDSGLTATNVQDALDEVAQGGGVAVNSVNGQTGDVVLDASDIGADLGLTESNVQSIINTFNTDIENLENSVETLDNSKAPVIVATAYSITTEDGVYTTFDDGADNYPMRSVSVEFTPNQSGSGDPSPLNIRPISGYSSITLKVSPTLEGDEGATWYYSPFYIGDVVTTVYGGTFDFATGLLTVTDANIASYNGETLPSTWISDRDVYAEGTTPTTGAQVVYKLETPLVYSQINHTVRSLLGTNYLIATPGEATAEYCADTELYIAQHGGGGGGGSVSPYTSNPAALGTANPGSSANYSRGDHVHPKPSASDIGAIAAPSSPATGAFLVWSGSAWVAQTLAVWSASSY